MIADNIAHGEHSYEERRMFTFDGIFCFTQRAHEIFDGFLHFFRIAISFDCSTTFQYGCSGDFVLR